MQSVENRPIFLSGVQENPRPSHYLNLIHTSQKTGREVWNIWYLFAFRPEATQHLARFAQEILRGPAPLNTGLRELVAAYTSYVNQCEFCTKAHVAVAAELLGSETLVWSALRDLESCELPEEEKALLRFAGKVTKQLPPVGEADIELLRRAGWTDEDMYYTITVCAFFNFYNRWITASGVQPCRMKVGARMEEFSRSGVTIHNSGNSSCGARTAKTQ